MSPSISIILPVYNGAFTLDRALRSVLAQEFADWEIVAVDDGSTDDTWPSLGSGSLTLSAVNTFGGTGKSMTLSAGTLNINNGSALGSASNSFIISSGTTISNTTSGLITLNNYAQTWQGDFTFSGSKPLSLGTGTVTLTASRQITVSATSPLIVGGNVAGAGYSLTKAGSGPLTLSGTNTFGGAGKSMTLSAGTLNINSRAALGNTSNRLIIYSGTTIDNTSSAAITTNDYLQTWQGNFTFAGTQNLNLGSGTVTLSSSRQVTVSGNTLTVGGVISGNFALTKAGAGELVLNVANPYTGGTTILAGLLNIGTGAALGTGSLVFSGSGTLQAGADGVALGSGCSVSVNSSVIATIDTQSYGILIAGTIGGGGALVKAGSGILTLDGADGCTGGTQVAEGTLDVENTIVAPVSTTGGQLIGTHAPLIATLGLDNPFMNAPRGQAVTNSGQWGPAVSGDTVTLTASVGTVTENSDGTWAWTWTPSQGLQGLQAVTITAADNSHPGPTAVQTFGVDLFAATQVALSLANFTPPLTWPPMQ
jgi:autotransporter-associated beta strand protein